MAHNDFRESEEGYVHVGNLAHDDFDGALVLRGDRDSDSSKFGQD